MFTELVTLAQWWSGSNCTVHLDNPESMKYVGREHTVVIMNHKYDIDWLMTWILAERLALLGVCPAIGYRVKPD